MRKRRIGLIGLGMAVTPHAKSLRELAERVETVAFSPSSERRRQFNERFGLPVAERLEDVIEDPSIDAVLLLTPPDARLELVQRIAAAGKPVLMEKPLERTLPAARRIVEITEAAGITTGVVFQHRFREGAEKLQALLAAGALGDIATVQLEIPWWRPQAYYDEPGRGTFARDGGGVLMTQAIHAMDLMLSFTGPAAAVQAIVATSALHRMEAEDFAAAGLQFANQAVGALMATTAFYPGQNERLRLAGTSASVSLEGGTLTIWRHDGTEETFGEGGGIGGGADPMAFGHDWHKSVIVDFLDALDEGRPPRVTARDALVVHGLIDAVLRSSQEGKRVIVE